MSEAQISFALGMAQRFLELPEQIERATFEVSKLMVVMAEQEDCVQMAALTARVIKDGSEYRAPKNEADRKAVIEHLRLYTVTPGMEEEQELNDEYRLAKADLDDALAHEARLKREYDALDRVLALMAATKRRAL